MNSLCKLQIIRNVLLSIYIYLVQILRTEVHKSLQKSLAIVNRITNSVVFDYSSDILAELFLNCTLMIV